VARICASTFSGGRSSPSSGRVRAREAAEEILFLDLVVRRREAVFGLFLDRLFDGDDLAELGHGLVLS
jgi:hypothetical protein